MIDMVRNIKRDRETHVDALLSDLQISDKDPSDKDPAE